MNSWTIDGVEFREIPSAPGYAASACGKIARVAPAKTRTVPYVLTASKSGRRYPLAKVTVNGKKFPMAIHRLVCEAWNGPCPSAGMHCCHNNGNPADNRAENLRWDTCGGNHADKVFHGTDPAGERNPRAKLSWDDVRKIRSEFSGKHGEIAELADRYGLSHSAMFSVVDGANWKDGYTSSREKKKKLTMEQAVEIRSLYAAGGVTQDQLGERYGVTQGAIWMIVSGLTFKEADSAVKQQA